MLRHGCLKPSPTYWRNSTPETRWSGFPAWAEAAIRLPEASVRDVRIDFY